MKEANEKRVNTATTAFAIISGILAFGHGIIIYFYIQLGREEDKLDPDFGSRDFSLWMKVPFAILTGIFALMQLFASVRILILNAGEQAIKSIYYSSIICMLSVFGVAVYYTLEASQYNAITRQYPKTQDPLPHLMPMYWSLQMGASALFLFVFPMMLFIFYHKLEQYIKLQRQQREQKVGGSDLQGWCLSLFLLQALSNIGNIINLYQYSAALDSKDYFQDNQFDVYAFYLAVSTIVCVVAIALQLKNLLTRFLSKKQNILLAILVGLFQMGAFFTTFVKAVEISVLIGILGDDLCDIEPCEAVKTLKWEQISYSALTLISLLVQIPYLRMVSRIIEQNEQRDTLMTTQEAIES